jgi:hypothetical protein
MKIKLLLATFFIASTFFLNAQHTSKTFAITGKANNNFFWGDIKQVDINTGKVNQTLFEAEVTPFRLKFADNVAVASKSVVNNPTGLGVAACALDTRNNRLYFATMHFSDIRFLDLNKPDVNFTTVKENVISKNSKEAYQSEENQLTRMVIAADGYGYAISNDANHLIRFTTDKKSVVEDLGNLIDAENNQGISIHNKCTSWGGDVVADAFGKLVIISANHNLFEVDVRSRIATLTGTITGLPANFTTNGAAVDDEGNLVVSSANVFEGLYMVNMKNFAAVKVESKEPAFNASDLANGNLLRQKEAADLIRYNNIKAIASPGNSIDAKVYPNPLTGGQFSVSFEGQPAGNYTIMVTDLAGKSLQSKKVSIVKSGQVESVRLVSRTSRGMYLVKVLSEKKQLAFLEKIVVN